jgi:hypothetical protein
MRVITIGKEAYNIFDIKLGGGMVRRIKMIDFDRRPTLSEEFFGILMRFSKGVFQRVNIVQIPLLTKIEINFFIMSGRNQNLE